jgi:hypothetical protein
LYIIHTRWLHQWRAFVLNEDKHNARGTWEGVQPPGPISNDELFEKTKPEEEGEGQEAALVLKKNLRKVSMYRGVNAAMWKFFSETYGFKGQVIRRATLDIYASEEEEDVVVDQLPHEEQDEGRATSAAAATDR